MSLISSLYVGQNGLSTTSLDLGIIGDNVANAGTIGFKAGRASFADLIGESITGGSGQLGLGTRLVSVQKILTQGSLSTTGVNTDLAVSGSGLFAVRTNEGIAYTRNGQFTLDSDGFMVDLQGNRVLGFPADAGGVINGNLGDLQPGQATAPPKQTTTVTVRANLDSADAVTAPFDPLDPQATSSHSAPTQLFDSLGRPIDATIFFSKVADGSWEYNVMTDGANQTGGTPGVLTQIGSGTLAFNTDGQLVDAVVGTDNFLPLGATTPQPLTIDFGSPLLSGGDGTGMTQFARTSSTSFIGQDGFTSGDLAGVAIGTDGIITGTFTNGQTQALGQVGLANFPAADNLDRIGNNLLRQTDGSGEPNIGVPGTGGRGRLFAGTLEQANVDVATELVRMIVVQRNFQANSKTVSTADSMLSELIQLKR